VRQPKNPFDQFMEEAEELLAPLKLALRLIRLPKPSAGMPHQSVSVLRQIFGWDGFSFVFFTGLAFAFLQLPFQYDKARWCFMCAAVAAVVKLVHSVNARVWPRFLIAVLGATLAGLGVNRVNLWVSGLELEAIVREEPQIRIITVKAPAPPVAIPRSYLVFDGVMRFPTDQNLAVGSPLFFNYYYKATGPNPVLVGSAARLTEIASDFSPDTQHKVIEDFKARVAKEQKEHPSLPTYSTMMPQDNPHWDSARAYTVNNKPQIIEQSDLNELAVGTKIAYVLVELAYKDRGKVHHLRTCQFLQPPALAPGTWHYCEGFVNPD
jgi:hypothetical protein